MGRGKREVYVQGEFFFVDGVFCPDIAITTSQPVTTTHIISAGVEIPEQASYFPGKIFLQLSECHGSHSSRQIAPDGQALTTSSISCACRARFGDDIRRPSSARAGNCSMQRPHERGPGQSWPR